MSLTVDQLATLDTLVRTTASLGLIGNLTILFDHFRRWEKIRNSASRIIAWGCLASTLSTLTFLCARSFIPARGQPPSTACLIQATVQQYAIHASHVWFVFQTINIFLVMWAKVSLEKIQKMEPLYHALAWTVPLLSTFGPIAKYPIHSFYGDAGLWCWIGPAYGQYRVYLSIMVIWVIIGFSSFCYIFIWWSLQSDLRNARPGSALSAISNNDNSLRSSTRLRAEALFAIKTGAFMITYIFTYSGASANRIHALVSPPSPFWVIAWQGITMTGIGIWNLVTYFAIPYLLKRARLRGKGVSRSAKSATGIVMAAGGSRLLASYSATRSASMAMIVGSDQAGGEASKAAVINGKEQARSSQSAALRTATYCDE
ncbi:hypothetical protein BCR44DRAFT_1524980 [Catenaria anguillulae PL171]|uniref:G-protein coupled receptors family 2 profile 2 domain-containing protein n=1 Tax=Catenaria anguillulae PL171 TaxID=765915 RepID=A0A1Y2HQ33_9FUNG|nr:hypothetical protein BCR44DRAFT_1524980 [Catenaria anguillulae PL171]